jgi:hypothetical protein
MSKLVLCLALVGLAVTAPAQSTQTKNGIVRGIVRDEAKNEIPGVTVTLSSLERNGEAPRRVISNERGEYTFQAPPGLYELNVQLLGFETLTVPDLRLKENETMPLDVTLKAAPPRPRQ